MLAESSRVEGDYEIHAWTEQVLRTVARETNLVLASTRVAVLGSGPVAESLVRALAIIGARVHVLSDARDVASPVSISPRIDVVIATGEGHPPLTPRAIDPASTRPLIIVDAAQPEAERSVELFDDPSGVRQLTDNSGTRTTFVVNTSSPPAVAAGQQAIDWAGHFMPVTSAIGTRLRESGLVTGLRIGLSLVLEPKTANLALTLTRAGADVSVVCDAASTRDDVADALRDKGLAVFANSDADPATEHEQALAFLDLRPDVLVDDGSRLIRLAHLERPDVLDTLIGATEETTSGLRPLRVMERDGELRVPVIAANDAKCKTLFDNGYGTGQSTLFTTLDLLVITLSGKSVTVAGFGYVGRGVARTAHALGAVVTIAEVDPVKALEALHAGYEVTTLTAAAASADLVISATGIAHTVALEHLLALPDGAAVAVAGGVDQEISIAAAVAAGATRRTVAERVEEFSLPNGRTVLILDDGGCINCTAGEGNPIEIMDLSFGVQLAAVQHLVENRSSLTPGVHPLPATADSLVARLKIGSLGVTLDVPSREQQSFLDGWRDIGPHDAGIGG